MAFRPKQIPELNAALLSELMGNTSNEIIKHALTLIPTIKDGDVIHDNAAGAGAVSWEILDVLPEGENIQIYATDINDSFMKDLQSEADKKGWPITATVMDARSLTFPDDKFTHSFSTFLGPLFSGYGSTAKQIHSTLKQGGLAIAAGWLFMPFIKPLLHAHHVTRGEQSPGPRMLVAGCDPAPDLLTREFTAAEFSSIKTYSKEVSLATPDVRRWAEIAWAYLGAGPDGWTQEDEDKWDEAIGDIFEQLQRGEGLSKDEKGCIVMTLRAQIAVATK